MKKVSDITQQTFIKIAVTNGFHDVRFLTHWKDIIGHEYSEIILPVKIVKHKLSGNTILYVITSDLSFYSKFNFYHEHLLSRIHQYFNRMNITKIEVMIKKNI